MGRVGLFRKYGMAHKNKYVKYLHTQPTEDSPRRGDNLGDYVSRCYVGDPGG